MVIGWLPRSPRCTSAQHIRKSILASEEVKIKCIQAPSHRRGCRRRCRRDSWLPVPDDPIPHFIYACCTTTDRGTSISSHRKPHQAPTSPQPPPHRTDRHAAQKQSAIRNVDLIAAAIYLQDNNLSLCLLLKFPG